MLSPRCRVCLQQKDNPQSILYHSDIRTPLNLMSRIGRHFQPMVSLRGNRRPVTAAGLAERHGVSVRTIYRDNLLRHVDDVDIELTYMQRRYYDSGRMAGARRRPIMTTNMTRPLANQ